MTLFMDEPVIIPYSITKHVNTSKNIDIIKIEKMDRQNLQVTSRYYLIEFYLACCAAAAAAAAFPCVGGGG